MLPSYPIAWRQGLDAPPDGAHDAHPLVPGDGGQRRQQRVASLQLSGDGGAR